MKYSPVSCNRWCTILLVCLIGTTGYNPDGYANPNSSITGIIREKPGINRATVPEATGFLATPDPPVLLSPADGLSGINVRPILTWNFQAGVTAWHLQVSLSESFSTTIYDDPDITSTSRQVGALPCNRNIYWRVRARNASGWSNYSGIFHFYTNGLPQVSTISIRNSFFSPGSRPTGLAWDGRNLWMVDNLRNLYKMDAAGNVITSFPVVGYSDDRGLTWDGTGLWLVVGSRNYKLDTLGNHLDTLDVQHWWHSGLDWDGKYFWFGNYNSSTLHKHNRDGSEILNFELNEIFGHPTGLAYDGMNIWVGTSSEGFTDDIFKYSTMGPYLYEFNLATIGISPPSGSYASLAWDGESLWYATDDQFTIYRFNVPYYHQPPAIPMPVSPADGTVNEELIPTLIWNQAENAATYHLQVATDIAFSTLVKDIPGISSTFCQVQGLEKMTTYFWHVRATNSAGTSSFSEKWSFTTRGIDTPTLLSAAYGNGKITLTWNRMNEPDLAQYNIYRDPSSPAVTLFDSLIGPSATDTTYTDSGINPGMNYYYRITAKDSNGNESGFSNEVNCTIPFDRYSDSLALVAIYENTEGTSWTDKANWLTGNVSTWSGITLAGNRVVSISLDLNNLTGTIPSSIAQLDQLQFLIFPGNQLSGTLTPEIGNMANLQHIDLNGNQFTGPIPAAFSNLVNLISLDLENNLLTGEIPSGICDLANLEELVLEGNQLSGPIPGELGNLANLKSLNLSENKFTGIIPATLGNLTSLVNLCLHSNALAGQIPPGISNLTNLTSLRLEQNQLTDPVSVEWNKLTKLEVLHLNDNQLTDLPDLAPLTVLYELLIDANRFTFEDIEPNINIPDSTFIYSPQDSVGTEKTVTVAIDSSYTFSVNVGGLNNQYQWYRNGNLIAGAEESTYFIGAVKKEDYGTYQCMISNTLVPGLTLISRPIHIIPDASYILVMDGLPYFEDFESGAEYWSTGGQNSSWAFGTPSGATINTAASGTNVWMTNLSGNHNPNETSYVVSPFFDLSLLSSPAIEMKVWWDCEGTYDGACLQYSEDSAKTWYTLQKSPDHLWYNSTNVIGLLVTAGSAKGWSGDGTFGKGSNGWVPVRAPITGPADYSTLRFRILFASNGNYENDGFAFDDIKICSDPAAGIQTPGSRQELLKIYPNPFRDRTTIEFPDPGHSTSMLIITDLTGKVVRIIDGIAGGRVELDRCDLLPGFYLVEVRGEDGIYRGRILVE